MAITVITRKIAKSDIPMTGMRTRASRESTSRTIAHLSDKFEGPATSPKASNAVLEFSRRGEHDRPRGFAGCGRRGRRRSRACGWRREEAREDRPPFRGHAGYAAVSWVQLEYADPSARPSEGAQFGVRGVAVGPGLNR